jgi:hypothetical protein
LFAAFRIVFELLVVKEKLFTRGKDEVSAAVAALQDFVYEFHGLPPTATAFTGAQSFPYRCSKQGGTLTCPEDVAAD